MIWLRSLVALLAMHALAQAFIDLLLGESGRATLARFGFQPPPAGAR